MLHRTWTWLPNDISATVATAECDFLYATHVRCVDMLEWGGWKLLRKQKGLIYALLRLCNESRGMPKITHYALTFVTTNPHNAESEHKTSVIQIGKNHFSAAKGYYGI